jgi:hypothetical protein
MTGSEPDKLVHAIPHPRKVRRALGKSLRNTAMLRRLLKLAEKAANERDARRRAADAN